MITISSTSSMIQMILKFLSRINHEKFQKLIKLHVLCTDTSFRNTFYCACESPVLSWLVSNFLHFVWSGAPVKSGTYKLIGHVLSHCTVLPCPEYIRFAPTHSDREWMWIFRWAVPWARADKPVTWSDGWASGRRGPLPERPSPIAPELTLYQVWIGSKRSGG